MEDHRLDFRWGIPELDSGFTTIPNYVIKHYAALGISPLQFALIVHLASYHYNSARGQASPSIATIAEEMGVTPRYVQVCLRSLEEKGYITIIPRPGKSNVYSVQRLALACLALEKGEKSEAAPTPEPQFTPEPGFTPTPEPQFTPEPEFTPPLNPSSPHGVNPSSPEEQEQKEKEQQQQEVVVVSSKTCSDPEGKLRDLGIAAGMAADLVRKHGAERIGDVLLHLQRLPSPVASPSGWLITALKDGYALSKPVEVSATEELLKRQRAACFFAQNPSLGKCPAEENGGPVYPWCKGCKRGGESAS